MCGSKETPPKPPKPTPRGAIGSGPKQKKRPATPKGRGKSTGSLVDRLPVEKASLGASAPPVPEIVLEAQAALSDGELPQREEHLLARLQALIAPLTAAAQRECELANAESLLRSAEEALYGSARWRQQHSTSRRSKGCSSTRRLRRRRRRRGRQYGMAHAPLEPPSTCVPWGAGRPRGAGRPTFHTGRNLGTRKARRRAQH